MIKKLRARRSRHPFLLTDGRKIFHKNSCPSIGLDKVCMTKHHLYPKDRKDILIAKENFILKIWCYKHFFGWNRLFQFCYKENNLKIHTELSIDEILTLMIERHRFITDKIGTDAWKIVFKDRNIEQAIDLLCRLISIKFNIEPKKVKNSKIEFAITKLAA